MQFKKASLILTTLFFMAQFNAPFSHAETGSAGQNTTSGAGVSDHAVTTGSTGMSGNSVNGNSANDSGSATSASRNSDISGSTSRSNTAGTTSSGSALSGTTSGGASDQMVATGDRGDTGNGRSPFVFILIAAVAIGLIAYAMRSSNRKNNV